MSNFSSNSALAGNSRRRQRIKRSKAAAGLLTKLGRIRKRRNGDIHLSKDWSSRRKDRAEFVLKKLITKLASIVFAIAWLYAKKGLSIHTLSPKDWRAHMCECYFVCCCVKSAAPSDANGTFHQPFLDFLQAFKTGKKLLCLTAAAYLASTVTH